MEEVVEEGALDPECVHLPNIFVDRVVVGTKYEKRIEVSQNIPLTSHWVEAG